MKIECVCTRTKTPPNTRRQRARSHNSSSTNFSLSHLRQLCPSLVQTRFLLKLTICNSLHGEWRCILESYQRKRVSLILFKVSIHIRWLLLWDRTPLLTLSLIPLRSASISALSLTPYFHFNTISSLLYACRVRAFFVCVNINHIAEPLCHHRLRLVSVWTYLLHISVAWIRLNRAFICGHLARILNVDSNISIILLGRRRLKCFSMAIRFLVIE